MQKTTLLVYLLLCCACGWQQRPMAVDNSTNLEANQDSVAVFLKNKEKINGLSLVSPPRKFTASKMQSAIDINANWVAISPFAFSRSKEKGSIIYNSPRQWWGERPEGVRKMIDYAQQYGLKVMVKPQVWIPHSWVGEYAPKSEEVWQQWEQNYEKYILEFARIAAEKEVELFCIGTEYRIAAKERPDYWRRLIKKLRGIYKGSLTYAANWDNFENIPFWDDLDYIGIDAYFPLIDTINPKLVDLKKAWQHPIEKIKAVQQQYQKAVLFTEYGYLSVQGSASKNWELEKKLNRLAADEQAQAQAFEALYQTIWQEDWLAGGFIWKWYLYPSSIDEPIDKGYFPKGKAAEKVIQRVYGEL